MREASWCERIYARVFHASLSCISVFLCVCLCEFTFVTAPLSCRSDGHIWTPHSSSVLPSSRPFHPFLPQHSHPSLWVICRTAGRHQLQFLWAAPWIEPGETISSGCLRFRTAQGPLLLVETGLKYRGEEASYWLNFPLDRRRTFKRVWSSVTSSHVFPLMCNSNSGGIGKSSVKTHCPSWLTWTPTTAPSCLLCGWSRLECVRSPQVLHCVLNIHDFNLAWIRNCFCLPEPRLVKRVLKLCCLKEIKLK